MPLNLPPSKTSARTVTGAIALFLLTSCAAPPPPERPAAPSSELTFDAGVDYAIDDLLVQARRLPAFSAAPGLFKKESDVPRGVIAVDPAIDGNTGSRRSHRKPSIRDCCSALRINSRNSTWPQSTRPSSARRNIFWPRR